MLHFLPLPTEPDSSPPYAEAVARLAGLKHALRLVDRFGDGPASDPVDDGRPGFALGEVGAGRQRCFDTRTGRVIAATADGLEALLAERAADRQPNPAATRRLAAEIRRGLEDISALLGDRPDARFEDPYPIAL